VHKVVVAVAAVLFWGVAAAEEPVGTAVAPTVTVEAPENPADAPPERPEEAAEAAAGEGEAPGEASSAAPAPSDAPIAPPSEEAIAASEVLAQADAPAVPDRSFEETQRLVGGAPLHNPNVRVHTVQKKRFEDSGKHELTLFPAVAQVNGKFTQHFGSALSYTYHLYENFAIQLTPQYNWYANESSFNRELIDKVRSEAQAASSLLLAWGMIGGVEVTPFYGKFSFLDAHLLQFSLVLNGGAGIGSTRHQLRPDSPGNQGATFGDTGNRFLGSIGGGVRVQFGDRFALRAEVRDLVYTAKVDSVNGCSESDLSTMNDLVVNQGVSDVAGTAQVSGSCQVDRFTGDSAQDVPRAYGLVKTPSSDALNNLGFYAGMSWLF
jgi:outer membrane beta-barrel protein